LDASDTLLVPSRSVGSIVAGATDAGSTDVTIPGGTVPGTYYIIAKADAGTVVDETSETNNTKAKTIKIGPDLIVYSMGVPSTAAAGAVIAVNDTTKNIGAGTAAASTTSFYLSSNGTWDASDTLLVPSRSVSPIEEGLSDFGSTLVTIPGGTATGTYYIIAKADAGTVVDETDETNNTLAKAIKIGPDLIVYSMGVPSTAAAGAVITVNDTTKNIGSGTAGASTTSFYLSSNGTWDASDTLLVPSRSVDSIEEGLSDFGSTDVTIPGDTAAGTYYIIAKADAATVVPESDETNNTKAKTITITP
jgi:subtilase family serine protease